MIPGQWNAFSSQEPMMKRLIPVLAMSIQLAGSAAAQELTKVRVAYDGFSMTSAPMIYADKTGIFKKFGLDVSPTFIDAGCTLTQALVGGSVDIAQNGYTSAVAPPGQGAGGVLIGG